MAAWEVCRIDGTVDGDAYRLPTSYLAMLPTELNQVSCTQHSFARFRYMIEFYFNQLRKRFPLSPLEGHVSFSVLVC
eukprot:2426759-Amphidinium_carterae.1